MAKTERPPNLPEYGRAPLHEVALGVQFSAPPNYTQAHVGEVWKLFKNDFPEVAEQPPLAPVYETFGASSAQQIEFGFGPFNPHNRYWFVSKDQSNLIQFQNDRFIHNWRHFDASFEYPRFESIIENFKNEFNLLEGYFRTLQAPPNSKPLTCNQVEVTYVNHIYGLDGDKSNPIAAMKICDFGENLPDDISFTYRKVLKRDDGRPYARLVSEAKSALSGDGRNMLVLTVMVRGSPGVGTIGNVLEFMRRAREIVVNEFTAITTKQAHEAWGRK